MRSTEKRMKESLGQRGYKLTPQRQAVLRVLASSREHLTPAAAYERVRQDHPHIGLVTVYRTLEILARLELVCRVHVGGRCTSYKVAPSGHHHHLICSDCGAVTDFADCNLGELEQSLSRQTGFEIDSHLLEFTGRCQNCQKEVTKEHK